MFSENIICSPRSQEKGQEEVPATAQATPSSQPPGAATCLGLR